MVNRSAAVLAFVLICSVLMSTSACLGAPSFGGISCAALTDAQRGLVERVYGEPAGMMVTAVAEGTPAAATGVAAGDILISIRMPEETDYYPMCGDMDEWVEFCARYQPSDKVRLLLLRNQDGEWSQVKCQLGRPIGEAVDEGMLGGDEGGVQSHVAGGRPWSFASANPEAVLARAPDGTPLTQFDVDVFGAVLAWSFNVRLTEAQKAVVLDTLIEYWQVAPSNEVVDFNNIRTAPDRIAQLTPEQKQFFQFSCASTFVGVAQQTPDHPFALLVMQIAGNAHNVLAGAGTNAELTQQDVDAILEMHLFQIQLMTGQAVFITPEQHQQLTQQIVEKFNASSNEEKAAMANADAQWGALRAAFAQAQAAQQYQLMQEQAQQWQQQYSQVYPNDPFMQGYLQQQPQANWGGGTGAYSGGSGSGLTPETLGMMQNMMDMQHQTSMGIINNMGGGATTNVYDSAGNFLYDY